MKYLTVQEVAEELKIDEESVRNYIKKGLFKAIRVGHSYRIVKESYDQFTTASEVMPDNATGSAQDLG